jgi:predicted methyltransferase
MRTVGLWAVALGWACSTTEAAPTPAPTPPPVAPPAAPVGEAHAHGAPGAHDDATETHRFDDAARWAKVFDDPARDAWQSPDLVVRLLELKPGQTVADIGAGTGYFNPHLARAVGTTGKVIAVDVEPALIAHLAERARRDHTPQVEARLATADDARLQAAEVDAVLMVDTYHHLNDRVAYFRRLRDAVKPGGTLTVVDFKPGADPAVGPPESHRIPISQVEAELSEAGWRPVSAGDMLPYQYLLTFDR